MGLTLTKLSNFPQARYHLVKAKNSGLIDTNLNALLRETEEKLNVESTESAKSFSDYVIKTSQFCSTNGLFTTLSLVIMLGALFSLKKQRTQKKLVVSSLLIAMPLLLNLWINSWPFSIVTENVAVKEGPSTIFNNLEEIPAGTMVIVTKKENWFKVIYPSRYTGWIKENEFKKLEL